MRTTEQLRQIEQWAKSLRANRGDTEWGDDERDLVSAAYAALAEVPTAPPDEVRRYT